MIRVENLCKSFNGVRILDKVNLTVEQGERIAIIGPSGCGKSLFLRSIDMLEKPDAGHIFIDGEEITAKNANVDRIRRSMGMVYQGFHLFEHMNVLDNITLAPRKLLKQSRAEAEAKAIELLKSVGLESKKYEMPHVLSGGQKQRAAIARCLAMDPKIMLFDEPTSALDPAMTGEVLATIRQLAKRDLTMIIVTHEMNFARELATRVLFFNNTGICEDGTPDEIFDNPQKVETLAFIRKLKFFYQHIDSRDFDLMKLRGGIMAFAEKYGISPKAAYRLQLCTEELVYELISKCFKNGEPIEMCVEIEYSEAAGNTMLLCRCGGGIYDPFNADHDNEPLGITIIRRAAKSYSYSIENERNLIKISF